jgi:hypothetical protein
MARKDDFYPSVPLPPGLDVTAIRRAIDYIEQQLAEDAAKKLKDKAVYQRKDVVIRDGKPIPRNGNGD